MKRLAAALIGAVAAGLATTAHAGASFEAFRALCINSDAAPAASFAAADERGWMAIPDSLLKRLASSGFDAAGGRIKTAKDGFQFMVVGAGERKIDGVSMNVNVCAVGSMPKNGALRQEAADWVKVPRHPGASKADQDVYVYADEAGARAVVRNTNDPEAKALLQKGAVRLLYVGEENGELSVMMFAVPTI